MLTRLYIQNYALIDSLDIAFPGNLVVISGETGAGKSILLGALSLLLGHKADVSVIGDTARNCVVEAVFADPDGSEKILRRVVTPQGRSRAFVDDEPVSIDELKAVSTSLVDLHSQFDHTMLSSEKYQLSILDAFAGTASAAAQYAVLYDSLLEVRKSIEETRQRISRSKADSDYVEFQFNQLDAAHLQENELEDLEAEQRQLANSEEISGEFASIENMFESEESSIVGQLRSIGSSLDRVASFIPEAESLRDRIEAARIELKDIQYETSALSEKIRFSPERLQEVDDRLALLYDLMRKHGVTDIAGLVQIRDEYAAQLGDGLDLEEELQSLTSKENQIQKQCESAASSLHGARVEAAAQLAAQLQQSARGLEMPAAVFEVRVDASDKLGRDGYDRVCFLFSANGGQTPKELGKCASGGELSRIMLCVKALMSRYMGMPTMIFDEIDTGVSGSVAYKMGEMIVAMGSNMQVMAITHLPQVASRGNAHFLVYKQTGADGKTHTGIRLLEGEEREREIARMLSGSAITDEAMANARSLMKDTLF